MKNRGAVVRSLWGVAMRKSIIVITSSLFVAACAGRAPAPVATVQAQDAMMTCGAIIAEVEANNVKVQQLASDKGLKVTQNVAAGVAGIFIPVLWFGMDWQGAEDKEIAALQSRQQYLAALAGE